MLNYCELASMLLEGGAIPNLQLLESRKTPLNLAVEKDCPECITNLIHFGASTKHRDSRGFTPLHQAILFKHEASIQAMMD